MAGVGIHQEIAEQLRKLSVADESRSLTPPNYPTYKVHFSEEHIKSIVETILPGAQFLSHAQSKVDRSYNNRVYYIKITYPSSDKAPPSGPTDSDDSPTDLVLKICGTNWEGNKVQNEVISLALLQKYCSVIPTPRIIAWSENGETIQLGNVKDAKPFSANDIEAASDRGWILMTKLPGRRLVQADLEGISGDYIVQTIADWMYDWRTDLPPTDTIGNLRFYNDQTKTPTAVFYCHMPSLQSDIYVDQILLSGDQPVKPLHSSFEYWKYKLESCLANLDNEPIYRPNRYFVGCCVKSVIDTPFKDLALFQGDDSHKVVFTHFDLSPRNILVVDQPDGSIVVTGLVDFEFSGFFAQENEFTNSFVNHEGDWPDTTVEKLLEELEKRGIKTPATDFGGGEDAWEQACALEVLMENTAPWWISNTTMNEEKIAEELKAAKAKVCETLRILIPQPKK